MMWIDVQTEGRTGIPIYPPNFVCRGGGIERWPIVFWLGRHFQLLLCNHWKELDETWQEARNQHPQPSLCYSNQSEIQYGHPDFRLVDILNFYSVTAEQNFIKLNTRSKYQLLINLCFWADQKYDMATPTSDWKDFSSSTTEPTELDETWKEASIWYPLQVLFAYIRKWRYSSPGLRLERHFRLFLSNPWMELRKLERKQVYNLLYQVYASRSDSSSKTTSLASD